MGERNVHQSVSARALDFGEDRPSSNRSRPAAAKNESLLPAIRRDVGESGDTLGGAFRAGSGSAGFSESRRASPAAAFWSSSLGSPPEGLPGPAPSSLTMVPRPWLSAMVAPTALLRFTKNVSLPSTVLSPFTVTV